MSDETPPVDAGQMYAQHEKFLSAFNQYDPASPVFKRPDLEAKYKGEAQTAFEALCLRAGIPPTPAPITSAALSENQHEAAFGSLEMSVHESELIETRVEAAIALTQAERVANIAQIKADLAEQEWTSKLRQGALIGGVPSDKAAFMAEAGEAAYKQLVEDARYAFTDPRTIPAEAYSDPTALKLMAARGRYYRHYEETKPGASPVTRLNSLFRKR